MKERIYCKNCRQPIVKRKYKGHEWWSHDGSGDYCKAMKAEPPAPSESLEANEYAGDDDWANDELFKN